MPIQPENAARYPADWERRSFFVRFIRGKGRCEWCGAAHGKPHPVTGSIVVLTTAHVFDQAPEAASLLNLAGLCQRCHLGHDRAHHAEIAILNRDRRRGQATFNFPSQTPRNCPSSQI
jgi:ribosomal protein S18 acetylase RimI-like enzyme